jgi:hypothetical protein
MGTCERNKASKLVSIDPYRIVPTQDSELDFAGRLIYSTSRGAVYPGFAMTEYFMGLPF